MNRASEVLRILCTYCTPLGCSREDEEEND